MSKAQPKKTAKGEIKALNAKFVQHANAKDPDALVRDFYATDAILMPPGSPKNFEGVKAIRSFWEHMILNEKAEDVTLHTQSVASSGDLAYEIGQFGFTTTNDKGVRSKVSGKYVVVYQKQSGGNLKAAVDMFSVNQLNQ